MAGGIEGMSATGVVQPSTGQETAVPTRCRPFNVVDGMIAVAAVAVGLALARIVWAYSARSLRGLALHRLSGVSGWWAYLRRHPWVVGGFTALVCSGLIVLLLVGSLAFLSVRLRRPRPPAEQLVRQPGMVAVEAMWAGLLGSVILGGHGSAPALGILALAVPVPAAWAALAWTGRWQPEPGWIDRFGRALGVWWCQLVAFYLAGVATIHAFAP